MNMYSFSLILYWSKIQFIETKLIRIFPEADKQNSRWFQHRNIPANHYDILPSILKPDFAKRVKYVHQNNFHALDPKSFKPTARSCHRLLVTQRMSAIASTIIQHPISSKTNWSANKQTIIRQLHCAPDIITEPIKRSLRTVVILISAYLTIFAT